MSIHVELDFPEEMVVGLTREPSKFADELRIAAAVKWYELGQISQGRAAGIAGLSRFDFVEALARYQVSPIQTTEEELRREAAM